MNTAIVITLIVCSTLIIMQAISAIDKANQRKSVMKKLDRFSKAFPAAKRSEKIEIKEEEETKDDLPKFGEF